MSQVAWSGQLLLQKNHHPRSTVTCPRFSRFFFQKNNNQEHSLSHTLSLSHTHTHTVTHSRVHWCTHPAMHTRSSDAHSHTLTPAHPLTHTHTHTHTHIHKRRGASLVLQSASGWFSKALLKRWSGCQRADHLASSLPSAPLVQYTVRLKARRARWKFSCCKT